MLWDGNGWSHHFWPIVVYGRDGGDIGGPNLFLLLAKISMGGCERLGKMFADELKGEARQSGIIAVIDGRSPC